MGERKLLEKVFKADCLFKAILQDDDGGVCERIADGMLSRNREELSEDLTTVDDLKATSSNFRIDVAKTDNTDGIEFTCGECLLTGGSKFHLSFVGGEALDGAFVPRAEELTEKVEGLTQEIEIDVDDLLKETNKAVDNGRTIRGFQADKSVENMKGTACKIIVTTNGGSTDV